jgi:intracellular sulfur oxidation DsrE/DsrF family protein
MDSTKLVGRRGLFAVASAGAVLAAAKPGLAAESHTAAWRPTNEPQDAWMELPGRHRMVFDASTAPGAEHTIDFASTFYFANKEGYGLGPADLGVIVILRHFATPFAFGDATWTRWGGEFSKVIDYKDPKTKAAPARNALLASDSKDPDEALDSLSGLAQRGAHFAVCGMATKYMAKKLAGDDAAKAKDIHAQLVADLIHNAHMVPAGIVALNRAQEHGYAVAHMG